MGCGGSKQRTGEGAGTVSSSLGPSAAVTAMYEDDPTNPYGGGGGRAVGSPSGTAHRHRRSGSAASSDAGSNASTSNASRVRFDGAPRGAGSRHASSASLDDDDDADGDLLTPKRVLANNKRGGDGHDGRKRPAPIALPSSLNNGGGGSSSSRSHSTASFAAGPPQTPVTPQHVVIMRNEILGRGGYGTVYKAYNKTTKTALAVKECQFDEANVALVHSLRKEYEMLSSLDHEHIVKVHHFTVEANKVARIYMELMPSGSVRSLMASLGGRFSETSARRIMHQALLGLQHLHQRGILHRDLKPDNMLIDGRGIVKLSDFGTSKATIHSASGTTTMVVGTVVYMAPETISGRYSRGSDVWAMAASFLELVSGELPWSELGIEQTVALLFHIGNAKPPHHHPRIPSYVQNTAGRRLLKRCFALDPKARPTVAEILAHPYFSFADFAGDDDDHSGSRRQQPAATHRQQPSRHRDPQPSRRLPDRQRSPPPPDGPVHHVDSDADAAAPDAAVHHMDDFEEVGSESLGDSFASISSE